MKLLIWFCCRLLYLLWNTQRVLSIDPEILACLRQERASTENPTSNVVTVTSQQPAYLHCIVPHSANHMVAWTRATDQAILTAGQQSFSADPRWQVSKKGDDWILILRRAEVTDTGCYFCDISTDTENTLYAVYLNVLEPPSSPNQAQKKQPRLMANMAGDEVLLNCTIYDDPEEIQMDENYEDSLNAHHRKQEKDVVWTRDGQLLNFNDTTKYVWKVKRWAGVAEHIVRIRSATMEDDGDYACERGHTRASQIVHINRSEAQKRDAKWKNSSNSCGLLIISLVTLIVSLTIVDR